MKRISLLLLSLLLLLGSVAAVGPAVLADDAPSASPEASAAPETAEEPASSFVPEPLAYYRLFDQPDWQALTSAVMFEADLDGDGAAEPVSFACDEDEDVTAVTWGESTLLLDEGSDFVEAAILDLDAGSPFLNLLLVIDYGSDSYITIEAHPENGQLVKGTVIQGDWSWEEGALWFYERTDFLGTEFGKRTYGGDDLHPDSPWLTMTYIPTAEEWAQEEDLQFLMDGGTLLHTIRPVPCTMDGAPGLIPADVCLYRLRFRDDDSLTEVALLDGTVAQIAYTVGEDGWPYLIDGLEMDAYFDNLFFAD